MMAIYIVTTSQNWKEKKKRKGKKKTTANTTYYTTHNPKSKITKFNILKASVVEFKHTLKDKKGHKLKFCIN
jgi:hypothetical protein